MSTKLELEIIDGENALALLGQLADIARGISNHDRKPFKVTVSHKLHVPGGDPGSNHSRTITIKPEIGLWVWGINMADPSHIEIRGYILDEMLDDAHGLGWLAHLLRENQVTPWFTGNYDVRERSGYLYFE